MNITKTLALIVLNQTYLLTLWGIGWICLNFENEKQDGKAAERFSVISHSFITGNRVTISRQQQFFFLNLPPLFLWTFLSASFKNSPLLTIYWICVSSSFFILRVREELSRTCRQSDLELAAVVGSRWLPWQLLQHWACWKTVQAQLWLEVYPATSC